MRRIFLVGNGPSLKQTPIDDLIGEDVMVMNRANHIWKELGFKLKPKYYFKIDYNFYDRFTWKDEVAWAQENCQKLYLWELFQTGYKVGHSTHHVMPDGVGNIPNVEWIKKCKDSAYSAGNWKATQSWHLPTLCTAFGGMSTMIQIAAMEYDEIYLLGCDLGYEKDPRVNHAIAEYNTDPTDKSEMNTRSQMAIHEMARRCSPVPIFNATIGGHLEVYERVNVFELLKGKEHV